MPAAKKPAYRLLNADQQATILHGQLLQAEADHFRAEQQLAAVGDDPNVNAEQLIAERDINAKRIERLGATFDKLPKKTRDRLNPPGEEPAA